MKAKKKVCALCFDTNTELVRIGHYTYARPCKHGARTPLLTLAEPKETELRKQEARA